MSIASNIDYGVLSRIHVPLEQPSELEVMLMSTVSAVPQGATKASRKDSKGGLKSNASSHDFKPHRLKKRRSPLPTARGSLSLIIKYPNFWLESTSPVCLDKFYP